MDDECAGMCIWCMPCNAINVEYAAISAVEKECC